MFQDIKVCEPPKPMPTLQGGLPNDPAIIQVFFYKAVVVLSILNL